LSGVAHREWKSLHPRAAFGFRTHRVAGASQHTSQSGDHSDNQQQTWKCWARSVPHAQAANQLTLPCISVRCAGSAALATSATAGPVCASLVAWSEVLRLARRSTLSEMVRMPRARPPAATSAAQCVIAQGPTPGSSYAAEWHT